MIQKFIPSNDLEHLLVQAQDGLIEFSEFIKVFLESELIVPSASRVTEQGDIAPLLFDKEGQKMLSIFTSPHLLDLYKERIVAYITMKGRYILEEMPKSCGIVVNPGYSVGFDVPPDGIKNILNDF